MAQNSEFSCHRGRVKVKIIVTRDRIDFPDLAEASVPEDAQTGDFVTTVQAIGDNAGALSYEITAGNIGNAFQINSTTGEISVVSQLDFETQDTYNLTIEATNPELTSNSGTATQVIRVIDVNEQPFFNTQCAIGNTCMFSLAENEPSGTPVDEVRASDPDSSAELNGILQYSLDPVSVPFQISSSGELTTTIGLDREDIPSHTFDVIVTDLGDPQLGIQTTVTVTVTDVNDNAPSFLQGPTLLSVFENAELDVLLTQYIANDDDEGINAQVTYALTDPSVPFRIDPMFGLFTVNGPIDFETMQEFTVTITASNPVPNSPSASVTTRIIVVDVNDNTPVFTEDPYMVCVTEHTDGPGTSVITVLAMDIDSGNNSEVRYSITAGNIENVFTLNEETGEIVVSPGVDLDREILPSFSLTVQARDLGDPAARSTTTTVNICVNDINDNAPVFIPASYSDNLREDAPVPQDILQVFAFDEDESGNPNSQITYEITSGNDEGTFEINDITGVISLVQSLNFEMEDSYLLEVTATDQGTVPMSGTTSVAIEVININEFPPVVSGNETIDLSELTPIGEAIAEIIASDVDGMGISFTIMSISAGGVSGASDGFYSINDTGFVFLEQSLDFEITQSYTIVIQVSDGEHTATTFLSINVLDANDNIPIFGNPTFFQTTEESLAPASIGTVVATDADSGTNGLITYSIVPTSGSHLFNISSSSGEITTSQVLDREDLVGQDLFLPPGSTLTLTIEAVDSGTPQRISLQDITIQLLDINDNTPTFGQEEHEGQVRENLPAETFVFQVSAMDSDLGSNGDITYSLQVVGFTSDDSPFEILSTGDIQTTRPLDREEFDSYSLMISATDAAEPARVGSATATVRVLDENDNAPEFIGEPYQVVLFENADVGPPFFIVGAFDDDESSNADIEFSIEVSADSSLFSIDPLLGEISLAGSLDFETQQTHSLTVIATDAGMPQQTSTAQLMIEVRDVDEPPPNDNAPIFSNPPSLVQITDSQIPTYSLVATVEASDPDIGSNGAFQFSITEDQLPGDIETQLTVTATDMGVPSRSSSINITVQFESPCALQEYSIGPDSGEITVELLCSVTVSPLAVSINLGGDERLFCNILRNIPTEYQWQQNDSFVTTVLPLPSNQPAGDLLIIGAQFHDAGEYECKAITDIGSLQSVNATVVSIQGMWVLFMMVRFSCHGR